MGRVSLGELEQLWRSLPGIESQRDTFLVAEGGFYLPVLCDGNEHVLIRCMIRPF